MTSSCHVDSLATVSHDALALRVKALSRLHELALRLAGTSEPQPALQAILETLVEVHRADFGMLLLYDANSGRLSLGASVGLSAAASANLAEDLLQLAGSAYRSAFVANERQIIEDAQTDPRFESLRDFVQDLDFRSVHNTPILTRSGVLLGVLSVHCKLRRHPSECEIQLADLCARHAADAIEIARRRQALGASDERLRLATRTGKLGIWNWDIVENQVSWSDSLYAIHGLAPAQFSATVEGFAELVHPEDRDAVSQAIERALAHGEPYELEFRAVRPDGVVIWLFTNAVVVHEQGRPVRMLGATMDITAYHGAELAMRGSQERFSRFMQHLPGLAWIKDVSGRYVFANDAALKAFQTTPAKLYGNTDAAIFPSETAHQFARNDEKALATEAGLQTIETLEHEDGTLHHSLVNKFSIPGPDGAPAWIGGMAIDITDRKQAEESLRASEERFRALADHAPVGIFQSGPTGEALFVNEGWCALAGLTAEQASGRGWLEAVHPEDRERVSAGWSDAVRSGSPSATEFRFRRPNGQVTWLQGDAVPLRTPDGQFAGYIGTIVDITERKSAEIALRESEQRFRHMADHAPVMIWVTDADGSCTFLGKSWYDFTGRTPEESLGFGWIEAMHPADRVPARDSFLAATAQQHAYRLEYRLQDKDGHHRWVIDAAVPRFAEDGRFLGFIGSVIDITARKLAEEALRTSEQLYRAIGESIDFGVWICDPQGNNIYTSESLLKLVGMTQEQCSKFGWGDALHPDDVERTIAAWQECVRSGGDWDVEHRFRGVDGHWHPILARGVPVRNERGEITAWAGINLDISRLKQVEDELREADRRKDEFLAVLAHELRNPLAPIRTGLELMRLAGDDRAAIEEVRSTMDRQSQQMVRLIDDLLDVSRITRGTVELRKCRVELRTVIDSAVETARPVIEESGHKLTVSVPKQPIVLEADATRLAQVISNLLNNAAKYMNRGGSIELTAERQEGTAIVRVKDSGIGIPDEMIDRIFDMFTQVDGSLERAHGGLGIGLTLVKRLVEMHDGSVEARSAGPDQGSEFRVRLPAVVGLLSEPVQSDGTTPKAANKRRVLVVDDNETATQVLAMLLKALGNDVRTAFDGLTAIVVAEQFRPDIVLLDIGMPKLNGYETARRLREQPWGKEMVLAALTGWGQEEDRRRTREAGFDHHFVKPIEADVLQKLLAEHEPGIR